MEMNVVGGAELCRVMAHIPHVPPMLLSGSGTSEEPPWHKNKTAEEQTRLDANVLVSVRWAGLNT